jgi:hypothetical protein
MGAERKLRFEDGASDFAPEETFEALPLNRRVGWWISAIRCFRANGVPRRWNKPVRQHVRISDAYDCTGASSIGGALCQR